MSEYNSIEYPVTYLMWTLFSLMLVSLLIVYSAVFSKVLLKMYLRAFLSDFTGLMNYAYSLPDGSEMCIPVRNLIKGGFADITIYQTYDKTWVTVDYVVKNPILKTVGEVKVSAPLFGYIATNYDPIANKYIVAMYFNDKGEYKSPYSNYTVSLWSTNTKYLMTLSQVYKLKNNMVIYRGENSVMLKAGYTLPVWKYDLGVPIAVCVMKKDGVLVIENTKNFKILP